MVMRFLIGMYEGLLLEAAVAELYLQSEGSLGLQQALAQLQKHTANRIETSIMQLWKATWHSGRMAVINTKRLLEHVRTNLISPPPCVCLLHPLVS